MQQITQPSTPAQTPDFFGRRIMPEVPNHLRVHMQLPSNASPTQSSLSLPLQPPQTIVTKMNQLSPYTLKTNIVNVDPLAKKGRKKRKELSQTQIAEKEDIIYKKQQTPRTPPKQKAAKSSKKENVEKYTLIFKEQEEKRKRVLVEASKLLPVLKKPVRSHNSQRLSKNIVANGHALENPSSEIVDFGLFLGILTKVPDNNLHEAIEVPVGEEIFLRYKYEIAEMLYIEGMALLLSCKFKTVKDATNAIRTVTRRAFRGLSVTCHKSKTEPIIYRCARKKADTPNERTKVEEYVEGKLDFKSCYCSWSAKLIKEPATETYYFKCVGSLENHTSKCFVKRTRNSKFLLKFAEEMKKSPLGFAFLSDDLVANTGIVIEDADVKKHVNSKIRAVKKVLEQEKDEYMDYIENKFIEHYNKNYGKDYVSSEDDRLVLGALCYIKETKDTGFVFEFEKSAEERLSLVVFMTSSQKENIASFGDTYFIDSTFNVTNEKHKALFLTLINSNFKSRLGAAAFVLNECASAYERLLKFVNKHVPLPRRIPLCLISDSAPQIHLAMSKCHPYAVHYYCAFHLLREGGLFGKSCDMSKEDKNVIRNLAYNALIPHSMNTVENAISDLCECAKDPKYAHVKDRLVYIACQSSNSARSNQIIFTGDTISSSRAEATNRTAKEEGLNTKTPLSRCVVNLYNVVKKQQHADLKLTDRKWSYINNGDFLKILDLGSTTVSKVVLEKMYFQFLLSIIGKYEVKGNGTTYSVTCTSDKKNIHDTYTVTLEDNNPICLCSVRMGYPCRHMFAVVQALPNLKITPSAINSRFHINGDPSKIAEANRKASSFLLKAIKEREDEQKKKLPISKRIAGVSRNIRNGIDVEGALERDLKRFGRCERDLGDDGDDDDNDDDDDDEEEEEIAMVVDSGDVHKVVEVEVFDEDAEEFSGLSNDVLESIRQEYSHPKTSRSPDLGEEEKEANSIRARNKISKERISEEVETTKSIINEMCGKKQPKEKQLEDKLVRDLTANELEDMFHQLFLARPDKVPFDVLREKVLRFFKEIEEFYDNPEASTSSGEPLAKKMKIHEENNNGYDDKNEDNERSSTIVIDE